MRSAAAALLLLALGCASSSTTSAQSGQPEPELQLIQLSNVAEAARGITGGIAVQYRLTIRNTTSTPLQLRRIDLQSMGSGAYTLSGITRSYNQTIDAGASQDFDLWGTAYIDSPSIAGANGPVTIRAIAQFESSTGRFQTVVVQQVHAGG